MLAKLSSRISSTTRMATTASAIFARRDSVMDGMGGRIVTENSSLGG